jgi:hypothetical protein
LKIVIPPEPVRGMEWVAPTVVVVVPASMTLKVPGVEKSLVR